MIIGFLFGLLLGALARFWMRWISTDPEFSWSGTLSIVIGFGIFGLAQTLVRKTRNGAYSRRRIILVRALGVILSLQLFVAAGAIMFPTVVTISLAVWRERWPSWIRVLLAAIGLSVWALVINSEIVDNFGWGTTTTAKIIVFGWIYGVIIFALGSTVRSTQEVTHIK